MEGRRLRSLNRSTVGLEVTGCMVQVKVGENYYQYMYQKEAIALRLEAIASKLKTGIAGGPPNVKNVTSKNSNYSSITIQKKITKKHNKLPHITSFICQNHNY